MKNIGIDARFLLRPLRGIPLYVFRLCQNMPALNTRYNFYFFINKSFEHNDTSENYQLRIDEIKKNNPNVTFVNCDYDAEIKWEQLYLPRLLKQYKIDLLHMPGNRICFFPGVPTVVTVHDVMEYLFFNLKFLKELIGNSSSAKIALYHLRIAAYTWFTYKFGINRAKKVITVSQYSSQDIVKHLNLLPQKISAIHHGLDNDFALATKDSATTIDYFGGKDARKHVLMLGGDSHQKNPEGAIAAWAKVPESVRKKYPLKIIGFCGSEQSPLLRALRAHGLADDVEVTGWVSQEDLISYLRSAVLFLYLSRYEGFGFPLLHAMASGTPVISTNKSSLPEVLGDVGFKVEPDDYAGAAKAIEKVLLDPDLWRAQAVAGVERSQMFSWRKSAERHLKVYEEVLEASSGSIF